MAFYQKNNPFKKRGNEEFEITEGGDNSKILKKYGWSGKTREEVKSTIKFNTSNQLEKQKKRDFYKIYGTLNK
tara:strand:- start:763 stop:981 length:219 start_codon:yes stop_codon:yes gene_type:complete